MKRKCILTLIWEVLSMSKLVLWFGLCRQYVMSRTERKAVHLLWDEKKNVWRRLILLKGSSPNGLRRSYRAYFLRVSAHFQSSHRWQTWDTWAFGEQGRYNPSNHRQWWWWYWLSNSVQSTSVIVCVWTEWQMLHFDWLVVHSGFILFCL